MNIVLPPRCEKFIAQQLERGHFRNPDEVVAAALEAMQADPLKAAPVFPPGSLAELYNPEANAEEAKTLRGNSSRVEAW
jgi:Arc/MetJ-type ribon-helix-helix transcriptional regulator